MPSEARGGGRIWTILDLLKWTTDYFQSHDIEGPRASAELLLAHTLGIDRVGLYVRFDQPLDKPELARFRELIKRRARREPVAYIVGEKGFWNADLAVNPHVLIPRPETEHLVASAIERIPRSPEKGGTPWRILDAGTGSGAIVIALASERPGHRYVGSDICPDALRQAAKNAAACGCAGQIGFFCGHWLTALRQDGALDMIVSNPPYIPAGELPRLQPEVRDFEPRRALDGGVDGLDAVREIIDSAWRCLRPGGWLLMEIGFDQRRAVADRVAAHGGYRSVESVRDHAGHDRVMVIRK